MRIITANTNGIRAAAKKGFFEWLLSQKADVVCIQETKAQIHNLQDEIFCPKGYHCFYNDAEKKGYSGVAIYSRKKPDKITTSLGWDHCDKEGRFIQADFGDLSVVSLYLPSGSSAEARQLVKFDFMERYFKWMKEIQKSKRHFIICGDWNIVHKEIDIKNFKSNQKSSGCLPEERAWLDNILTHEGFVDAFRVINKEPDQYTWWSARSRAFDKNVGWRIDYQITTPELRSKIKNASIYKEQRFSDHAPVIVDYDYNF